MKIFTGTVTSAKMPKTVTVVIARSFVHPKYGKRVKRTKNYLCHCLIEVHEGDVVEITEIRPMSRRKRFQVTRRISAGRLITHTVEKVVVVEKPKKAAVPVKIPAAAPEIVAEKKPAAVKPKTKKTAVKAAKKQEKA